MSRDVDAIDQALIAALEEDPYSTNRALGRKLGIPEVEVARRIRRMDEADIMRLSAALDILNAGYTSLAHVFLKCAAGQEPQLASAILDSPMRSQLHALHSVVGKAGVEATFRVADNDDLLQLTTSHLPRLEGVIAADLNVAYHILYQRTGIMVRRSSESAAVAELARYVRENVRTGELDDLDVNIIAELQYDGRQSSREIARKYNVTEGTIRYRLRKMDELALMRITPVRDPAALGISAFARVYLRVRPAALAHVSGRLLAHDHIDFLALSTGPANLHGILTGASREEIARSAEELSQIPGVESVSLMVMKALFFVDPRWQVLKPSRHGPFLQELARAS